MVWFQQHLQIADDLRAAIESGALRPGDVLPTEAVLAQQYRVARGTARLALAQLESEGLVASVGGKAHFVRRTRRLRA